MSKNWTIRHHIETSLPAAPVVLTYTDKGAGKGALDLGGTRWGDITSTAPSTGTPTLTIYKGKESSGKQRDFTIARHGQTLICSIDPQHDGTKGGGTDVAGGSWTATDP